MNWIRIDVGIGNDPRVQLMAASVCRGDAPKLVGHLVLVFAEMPKHARDGNVENIPDPAIESWARWTGKAGAFAHAFRMHMCDAQGVVRAWDKHNGSAIRRADADKERKRRPRELREDSAGIPQDIGGNSAGGNAYGTGRDGTYPPPTPDGVGVPPSDDPLAALPWPDPADLVAARAIVARGADPHGLAARLHGWAETGLGADGGRAIGWAAVASAVRDFRDQADARWNPRFFDGFLRRAAERTPAPRAAAPLVIERADTPQARCAAVLETRGIVPPDDDAWPVALGVSPAIARRIVTESGIGALTGTPVPYLVNLLLSAKARVAEVYA